MIDEPKDTLHVHLIGIGGSGLSAIARVLLESGYKVSGSDRQASPLSASLVQAGVRVVIGHRASNVEGADLVVRSSAIPDDNVEVLGAHATGIPVLKRGDFLGRLMAGKVGIAVAGSHGKTTTTAMIAWLLTALGQDPSFIIGGVSLNLGVNAHAGNGSSFVIEADEYDHMFLGLQPHMSVVTSVEHDHPDCYPTAEEYYQAFVQFAGQLEKNGQLIACAEEAGSARLAGQMISQGKQVLAYGWTAEGQGVTQQTAVPKVSRAYQAENLRLNSMGGFTFDALCTLEDGFKLRPAAVLQVPGEHNVLNALAALAVIHCMGLDMHQAGQALEFFRGTGRRFEVRGEADGVTVIDDYAHHPTEIRATLAAARKRFVDRKLWVVWQPHTYSRTRKLGSEFASSFGDADHILVTAIYAARESNPADGFSSQAVVEMMPNHDKHYLPVFEEIIAYLAGHLQAGDVLLVLSAGDADQISSGVLAALQERSQSHV